MAQQGKKQVSDSQFVKFHSQWAQEIANQTGQVTDLYRDPTGIPRCTIEGWPLPGVKVGTFKPQPMSERRRQPQRSAVPAVPAPVAEVVVVNG